MENFRHMLVLLLLVYSSEALPGAQDSAAESPRINILLILADDLGWNGLSCLGNPYLETPYIDRLAAQGALFTQSYCAAPICSPTRAALQSGQYGPRTGIYTVGTTVRSRARRKLDPPENRVALAPSVVTLAEVLKDAGYRTGIVGKWHLGSPAAGKGPLDQGYDWSIGADNSVPSSYFWPYVASKSKKSLPGLERGKPGEYLTDRLTEEAIAFMEADLDRPFFLYFSHYAPHSPFEAKYEDIKHFRDKDSSKTYKQATYAGMIRSLDQSVGRLVARLEESGRLENTLILFTSDNGAIGGFLAEGLKGGKKEILSLLPLRGGKGMLFEGGIRVPLVLYWKGHIPPGTVVEAPAHTVDYFPTILDAAGILAPEDLILDGRNLLPAARGKAEPSLVERSLFWHFPSYMGYDSRTFRQTPASVIRRGPWKLIHFYEDDHQELYNLEADPGEQHECGSDHPQVAADLAQRLDAWLQETKAAMPTRRDGPAQD